MWLRVSYQLRGLYLLGRRESSERLDSVIQTESVAEVDESGYCISVVLSFFALCASYPNTYTRDILVSALPILPLAKLTGHLGSRSSTRFGQTRGRSFLALLDLAVQRVFVGLPSSVWVSLLPARGIDFPIPFSESWPFSSSPLPVA